MKKQLISSIILGVAAMSSFAADAVGFKELTIADEGSKALTVGLWYPSDALAPNEPNTRFGMALALDAPINGANGGLVVISHGYSGWYAGHADTAVALAEAGYIVAAPSHTGNTWSDMSSTVPEWMLDRPRHISRVIDHLLVNEHTASHVAASKIGVYGFSAGGYTAVGLIGGVPSLRAAQQHCEQYPAEFVCSEGMVGAMIESNMDELPASAWGADSRIQAAVIAAPGWAFAYPEASLANVTADVQLWSAMLDESVPTETNAALLAKHLPKAPETHWVEGANHFAFLVMPCREAFRQEDPEEYAMICSDGPGFDRYAFHADMHKEMVRFYDDTLGIEQ